MRLAQAAAKDGKVLGVDKDEAAVDAAVARHDAIASVLWAREEGNEVKKGASTCFTGRWKRSQAGALMEHGQKRPGQRRSGSGLLESNLLCLL